MATTRRVGTDLESEVEDAAADGVDGGEEEGDVIGANLPRSLAGSSCVGGRKAARFMRASDTIRGRASLPCRACSTRGSGPCVARPRALPGWPRVMLRVHGLCGRRDRARLSPFARRKG